MQDNFIPPREARRRGAPYGNSNALKHGFYARRFNRTEKHDLNQCTPTDLSAEIAMLRVQMCRYLEIADQPHSPQEAHVMLQVLAFATQALNRLVRTQRKVSNPLDELRETLAQAARETLAELRAEFAEEDQKKQAARESLAVQRAGLDDDPDPLTPPAPPFAPPTPSVPPAPLTPIPTSVRPTPPASDSAVALRPTASNHPELRLHPLRLAGRFLLGTHIQNTGLPSGWMLAAGR